MCAYFSKWSGLAPAGVLASTSLAGLELQAACSATLPVGAAAGNLKEPQLDASGRTEQGQNHETKTIVYFIVAI
jgi:hypothetical protein